MNTKIYWERSTNPDFAAYLCYETTIPVLNKRNQAISWHEHTQRLPYRKDMLRARAIRGETLPEWIISNGELE